MAISIGDALLKLGVDDKDMQNSLKGLGSKINNSMASGLKTAGIAVASFGVAAVGAGIAATKKFAETADNLYEMSQRTGISTTALQELGYAAKISGSSIDGIEGAVRKMQLSIDKGGLSNDKYVAKMDDLKKKANELDPSNEKYAEQLEAINSQMTDLEDSQDSANAIERLGISFKDLTGQSPEKQFFMITSALADVKDPTEKAALAMGIFGKTGTSILPMLEEGSVGLQKYRDEAQSLGIVMDEASVKAGGDFNDSLDKINMQLGAVGNQIGAQIIPVLTPVIPLLMDLIKTLPIKELGKLITDLLPPLVQIIEKIIKAIPMDVLIKLVETVLIPVLDIIEALLPALEPILDLIAMILTALMPILEVLGKIIGYIAQIIGSGLAFLFSGGSTGFNMPALPSFAGGGIVPGPIGAPVPILAHGGESVGMGGGEIHTHVYLDGRQIAESVDRALYNRLNASGVRNYS